MKFKLNLLVKEEHCLQEKLLCNYIVGVLKLGVPVYMLLSKEAIMSDYKEVFDGVEKLKDCQIKLHLTPNVLPVTQPVRHTMSRSL